MVLHELCGYLSGVERNSQSSMVARRAELDKRIVAAVHAYQIAFKVAELEGLVTVEEQMDNPNEFIERLRGKV